MPPLDPRMQVPTQPPAGPPPDMPPEEPPPEQPGQELPSNPLGGGMKQASPEEQRQANKFKLKALQMVYQSEDMFQKVVQMLRGGDGGEGSDPVKGLAMTTEMLVARVGSAAEAAGETLSPDAVYHAGADIMEDLADLSREAGIKDYTQDNDALEASWFQALDLFRERLAGVGEIDEADAQAGLQQLQQADQDGTLDRTMRDIAASDESGQAGGPVPEEGMQRRPKGLGTAMRMQ